MAGKTADARGRLRASALARASGISTDADARNRSSREALPGLRRTVPPVEKTGQKRELRRLPKIVSDAHLRRSRSRSRRQPPEETRALLRPVRSLPRSTTRSLSTSDAAIGFDSSIMATHLESLYDRSAVAAHIQDATSG